MATTLKSQSIKLLDDLVEQVAPPRCVTFTGRISDTPDDMTALMFHNTTDAQVVHPRDGVQKWTAGERRIYSHLSSMKQWLDANVKAYMRTSTYWQPEIYPRRILYAYGMRGSGRLTLLTDFCAQNRVNLLVAWISVHTKDMLFSVYEKAATMTPCIVYINNATSIFSTPAYTNELIAAHTKCIDSLATNVWTVLAGSFAPKQLRISQQGPHPIHAMLLEPYGDTVHVPCISDLGEASQIAVEFVRDIAQSSDIIPRDYARTSWGSVVDHLARAFIFHTMQEMRRFVRGVFARHNTRCAINDEPISLPTSSTFNEALQQLVRTETCGQLHYKLFERNSYQAHARQLEAWCAYTNPGEPEPTLQSTNTPAPTYEYVPSALMSIASPARETELPLLPRCAPDRRVTKRQREIVRSDSNLFSLKPLTPLVSDPMSLFD